MALQHLRSSTANKRPLPAGMSDGQIAINTNLASPGLFIKDSNGDLVKIGPVHIGTTAPNASPASGGETGNTTGELWLDTSLTPNELKTWNGSAWVSATGQEIPVSKLIDGSARQLLQTDAAGTGVEWTSNVDVPGTLDVTSTATFDGRIYTTTGNAGSPAISPASDTDTGISFDGSGGVLLNSNASSILTVNATSATADVSVTGTLNTTGVASFPIGTDSAPGITFGSDKDTGIYSPGANQLAISTNGQGRLFVDASGNVGIATSAPNSYTDYGKALVLGSSAETTLGIVLRTGTSGTSSIAFADNSGSGAGAQDGLIEYSQTNQSLSFHTAGNSSPRLVIDSSGRLGLGTSQPVGQAYIAGPNTSNFGVAADAALNIAATNGALSNRIVNLNFAVVPSATNAVAAIGMAYQSQSGFGNGALIFGTRSVTTDTAPTERMRIDSSGNVGIGTTSPQSGGKLTVNGGLFTTGSLTASATNAGAVDFVNDGRGTRIISYGSDGSTKTAISFSQGVAGGSASEVGRWDSSGRLLVGTSSARANFFNGAVSPQVQIEGTGIGDRMLCVVSSASTGTSGPVLLFGKQNSGTVGGNTAVANGDNVGNITFQGHDGSEFVYAANISAHVDGTPGANDMPGRLVFSTTADGASSPTERMRISQAGNVEYRNLNQVLPVSDNTVTLGANGYRWSQVWAANGTIQTSDKRAKTYIEDSTLGVNFIKSLRPVSYKWIEGGKVDSGNRDEDGNYIYESVSGQRTHWGFIAQEVKQAVDAAGVDFGGWVLTDKDDPDSQQALRYDQFIAPLTKALQETMAELEALKAEVATLKAL